MTNIALGAEQVRHFERSLGGPPPEAAIEASKAALHREITEGWRVRRERRRELSRLLVKSNELLLASVQERDPSLTEEAASIRASLQARPTQALTRPRWRPRVEPRIVAGSWIIVKTPPYDTQHTYQSGGNSSSQQFLVQSDTGSGFYQAAAESVDGDAEAYSGFGVWFHSALPGVQQFSAYLQSQDTWEDQSSWGFSAHQDVKTRLWIWGAAEDGWVVQSDVSPSWSDSTGWFDHHGSYPNFDYNNVSVGTSFQTGWNSWYLCYVFSDVSVGANQHMSLAYGNIGVSVPWVVFEVNDSIIIQEG